MAESLDSIGATLRAFQEHMALRLAGLEAVNTREHDEIKGELSDVCLLVNVNSNRITRLEEQQTVRTGALGALTLVVGTVAAWLGMRQ